nr:tetratricopeptide repeat protein [Bacteroidota bacterium]
MILRTRMAYWGNTFLLLLLFMRIGLIHIVLFLCMCCFFLPLCRAQTVIGHQDSLSSSYYNELAAKNIRRNSINSLNYATRAYELALEENSVGEEIESLLLTGLANYYIQNTIEATEAFIEVIDHPDVYKYPIKKAEAYRGLALVNIFWENFESALKDLNNALSLTNETDYSTNAKILSARAKCHAIMMQHDSAIYYSDKVYEYFTILKDTLGIIYLKNNLGNTYRNMGNYPQARRLFEEALALNRTVDDIQASSSILTNLGNLYAQSNQIDSALMFLRLGERYALENNHIHFLEYNYKTRADLFAKENQTDSAFYYLNKYFTIHDTIFDQTKSARILAIQNKYVQEKKQREILILKEKEKQRNIILWSSIVVTILALIVLFLLRNHYQLKSRLHQKENEQLNQELAIKERELISNLIQLMEKGEIIAGIKSEIGSLLNSPKTDRQKSLTELISRLNSSVYIEKEWEKIKIHFDKVHPVFYKTLTNEYSNLTQNDLRLCAYIKLNLSSKEIASLTNIEHRTVQTAKYRLKKKLGITGETGLIEYLQNL